MKSAEQYAKEVDEALNLASGDREYLTNVFAVCQQDATKELAETLLVEVLSDIAENRHSPKYIKDHLSYIRAILQGL
jgi:hypothetical protein